MAAQLFHYDFNRLNFLKVLIYLTDVDEHNGPHCYVRGSHRDKPDALLHDRRMTDEEINAHYPAEQISQVTGPAGTVLIADTLGFHKGQRLDSGERLLFHLEYSDSLAGKPTERVRVPATDWAREQRARFPRLWHKYYLG
jgi:phytanoyl-CoA dioxygenase PhyH